MRQIKPWFGLQGTAEATPGVTRTIVVVGCPFGSRDAFRAGAAEGPEAIREWARTQQAIDERGEPIAGITVVDVGDVGAVRDSGEAGEARWSAIESATSAALEARPGAFLIGLGGDHAVTPPLAAAVRRAHGSGNALGMLLLDAHADCFSRYDGDPLSHACVLPRLWDRAGFRAEDTCIAGVRSYAFDELATMGRAALVVPSARWAKQGAEKLAEQVLAATEGRPLYISLDIDVLDPAHAPGTGYPVAGGPDVRQLLDLLDCVWQRQPVAALDLVEVAPAVDPAGITAANAAHVLLQVFGHVAAA